MNHSPIVVAMINCNASSYCITELHLLQSPVEDPSLSEILATTTTAYSWLKTCAQTFSKPWRACSDSWMSCEEAQAAVCGASWQHTHHGSCWEFQLSNTSSSTEGQETIAVSKCSTEGQETEAVSKRSTSTVSVSQLLVNQTTSLGTNLGT